MYFRNVRKNLNRLNLSVIASLDIGTSKVTCAIAKVDANGMQIIGFGAHATKGLKAGVIVDMEALEVSIAHAVHNAEEMADETVSEVFISVSPRVTISSQVNVDSVIRGHPVDETDVRTMITQGCHQVAKPDMEPLHSIALSFSIDGTTGIRDPRGMYGEHLLSNVHLIHGSASPLRNLVTAVERCHLDVLGVVSSVYAAGLATLVEDEMDLGITLIEMGADTTSIAIFYDGKLYYTDHIPLGGSHVTNDLARGLSTTLSHAERTKTLYGSAMMSPNDNRGVVSVPQIGDESDGKGHIVTRSELVRIIRPRIEETMEMVRDQMNSSDVYKIAGPRLVLTGGASQLPGVQELAGLILEKQARVGKPLHIQGTHERWRVPSYAACIGLLIYGRSERMDLAANNNHPKEEKTKLFSKVSGWVKGNF